MTAIAVGIGGVAGWTMLNRTAGLQRERVAADPQIVRLTDDFRARIGFVPDAETLVDDYRLLKVALGAFGLERDLPNKAMIEKILASDLEDPASLANRLSDKRYLRFAEAFGYGSALPSAMLDRNFGDTVAEQFIDREMERRVGAGDENLRLGLNARRELKAMAARATGDRALWYEVLSTPPLRRVFEVAFGLDPNSYGRIPIDRQHNLLMEKADKMFGSASFDVFADHEQTERLIRQFLVRAEVGTALAPSGRYSSALSLLKGSLRF